MLSLHYALPFCKGDLARSILYMSVTYRLPMRGMGQMLARWHKADPPDAVEHWRNDQIDALQHTRNPFIDSSEAVDLLERSEEHTSELQSLKRSSYAVYCLKKKTTKPNTQ